MDKKYTERVELHCHSVYTAEDGVSRVEDIIKFASDNRMPAVAITDHASVAGFGEADYFSRQGAGIKMIYGMEAFAVNDLEPAVVGDEDDNQVDIYFRTTDEMLDSFSYLGEEKAWEIVVENTNIIADSICDLRMVGDYRENYPKLDDAHLRLREICYSRLIELFGKDIPTEYINQLDWELHSFMESGADSLLLLTKELVEESGLSSYEIGYRGCLGGLLTAYLCGITCVDPLDSKYVLYPEFVIGLEGDKIPEISLIFPKKVQNKLWDTCGDLEDIGSAFHAGVNGTMSDSEAATAISEYEEYHGMIFDDDKRCLIEEHLRSVTKKHGMNPGAMLLVPECYEITEFSPLTKIPNGNMATEFSYHSLYNLWQLYILTNPHINMLSALINKTGIKVEKISLEDKEVEAVINGTSKVSMLGVPEVDSEFVRMLIKDMGTNSFTDLVQAISLSHGTNVWFNNMEILLKSGDITKESILATREDIFECLLALGFTREDAFMITEFVRKGKARRDSEKWEVYKERMTQAGAPDWFVDSCEKICYMIPRAHAYIYALHVWWTIWFKIHYPKEFYEAYMDVQASDRLKQIVGNGKEAFLSYKEGYLDALEDGFCVPDRISKEEFYVIEEMLLENNNF